MIRTVIALGAALPFLAVAAAQAQTLAAGKWTGTVTPPNEQQAVPVSYDVTLKGDTIAITVDAGEHGAFPFGDVKLSDGVLTFWFTPGPRVECSLTRGEDGGFQGPCRDAEGGTARMVMVPPKKE
jgi:hypothetical protein